MQIPEYPRVIKETDMRLQKMVAAFNASDFASGHRLAEEVGAMYSDDDYLADRIGYLVKKTASAMYFGGIEHQIAQATKEREKKFEPPF